MAKYFSIFRAQKSAQMELKRYTAYFTFPVGQLEISSDESQILSIWFTDAQKRQAPNLPESTVVPPVIDQCIAELGEYFAGTRKEFSVPYLLQGTDFQINVWNELTKIPYGQTITYGQQAARLQNEKAIRAVGTSNGLNRLSILIPCHRVIGANGSLVGYGGDLWVKKWLLEHEQKYSPGPVQMRLF